MYDPYYDLDSTQPQPRSLFAQTASCTIDCQKLVDVGEDDPEELLVRLQSCGYSNSVILSTIGFVLKDKQNS